MAAINLHHFSFFFVLFSLLLLKSCSGFKPKLLNASISNNTSHSIWSPAVATWYGSPNGGGTDGGACGYGSAVDLPPFNKMVSAGGPSLFKAGSKCGACYQVKCTENEACSGSPVTVTIADNCPGCSEAIHFDLSGAAFGAMAKPGQADQLRNAGFLNIQHQRISCDYPGKRIEFHVDQGSNPYYFAVLIEFEDGDGDVGAVNLREGGNGGKEWHSMQQSWGAVWKLDSGSKLQGPFSISLTTIESKRTVIAVDVIPANWIAGKTYASVVNVNP